MYEGIKQSLKKRLPHSWLVRYEPLLRRAWCLLYLGSRVHCVLCRRSFRRFVRLSNGELLCPCCGSLPRQRRLWNLLRDQLPGKSLLDFSPARCWYRLLRSRRDLDYTASDFAGEFLAEKKLDITAIDEPSERFDLVICYHVLEHVPEDRKALSELWRVLKKGGRCWVQTPFREGGIYEDPTITEPAERLRHFGQEDHVRVYSVQALTDRMRQAGFAVEVLNLPPDPRQGLEHNECILTGLKS